MTTNLKLTPPQSRLMGRLKNKTHTAIFPGTDTRVAGSLVKLGLIEITQGDYAMLTDKGRDWYKTQ